MQEIKNAYIVDAVRTPLGSFMGSLSSVPAPELGATVIKALVERNKINGNEINEVIMGNVVASGEGQAPTRQASIKAGLPTSVECLTINKVCGSGLKSVALAMQAIQLGDADAIIAGGMENMSLIPHYLMNSRNGYKMGTQKILDGMIQDGLQDPYDDVHMGNIAELCAKEYNLTREMQDDFAIESYKKSQKAIEDGIFTEEIVPVTVNLRRGKTLEVTVDEEPTKVNFEKLKALRPVFEKEGTITAANASSINDGASAVLIVSEEFLKKNNLTPKFKIVAQASAAKDPKWFTTAPVDSIKKVLKKSEIELESIDMFEINEAFAVVSLVVNKLLGIDSTKVNIHGGAVSLGHPIGASGARILTTLMYNMKRNNSKLGLASLCIGGGEATSIIIEQI